MRLSFNMKFNAGLDGILNTQQKMNRAQDQLTKQTRILTPADDPASSAKVLGLDQNLEQVSQFQNNSVLLKNNLALEETVLTNMRTSMDRVKTLAIASGNGTYTVAERNALSEELKNIQVELFDLMNTRNSEGGYIFSGFQDKTPAFAYDQASNSYFFQGDDGQKALQISPTIAMPGNDSGKTVFEDVNARFKPSAAVISAGGATGASITMSDQSQFDAFYRNNFDGLPAATNEYNVVLTAPSNYEILRDGVALTPPVTGTFTPDQPISFAGLGITISGAAAVPGQVDFTLQPPQKKNMLTTIGDFITALDNPNISGSAFNEAVNDVLTQIDNASSNIDSILSAIGGRVNVLDSVFGTNEDLTINNKAYRADLSEVDYAAAITEITKQEIALEAISATFTKVSGVSLFDYLR